MITRTYIIKDIISCIVGAINSKDERRYYYLLSTLGDRLAVSVKSKFPFRR